MVKTCVFRSDMLRRVTSRCQCLISCVNNKNLCSVMTSRFLYQSDSPELSILKYDITISN